MGPNAKSISAEAGCTSTNQEVGGGLRARRERRRSEGDAGESAGLDSGESVSGDFATAADFPREPAEVEDTGILRALGRRDAPAVLGRLASL